MFLQIGREGERMLNGSLAFRKLVPLNLHNSYVTHLGGWEPFNGLASGFSCPVCDEELFFVGGAYWKRGAHPGQSKFLLKEVHCPINKGGCGHEDVLKALPPPLG